MAGNALINPLESKEARAYANDPLVGPAGLLRTSFDSLDVKLFQDAYRGVHTIAVTGQTFGEQQAGVQDEWVLRHLPQVATKFYKQVLLKTLKPYSRAYVSFLAKSCTLSEKEVLNLLLQLILDGELHASIDQVAGVVSNTSTGKGTPATAMNAALSAVTARLKERMQFLPLLKEAAQERGRGGVGGGDGAGKPWGWYGDVGTGPLGNFLHGMEM